MEQQADPVSGPETVEVMSREKAKGQKWSPIIGDEALGLFEHLELDKQGEATLRSDALSVLSRCVPPTAAKGTETGLVIGYVQSGKTMSFTAVTALARDNGFRLIVVISGLTRPLWEQSTERLEKDLLRQRSDRSWLFLANPRAKARELQQVKIALASDRSSPGLTTQTVLISVMKNRAHLRDLIALLGKLDLAGVPTLLIDDEADQASLNNRVKQGSESTTYHQIVQLRGLLPHHTFLQYTATPQALLLIKLIDVLSPGFAVVLTPGSSYVGGKAFFESSFDLVRCIPSRDIPRKGHPLLEPPESLLDAMRLFFLGVADGIRTGAHNQKGSNRTMMVHPSKETAQHAKYVHWVRQIRHNWLATLKLQDSHPDRLDLMNDFEQAYADLKKTVESLAPFVEIARYLSSAIDLSLPEEVNYTGGGPAQPPDWRQQYAHIVVGGDVLNRGFTLEGLTVSYMPRSKGVGNADTIQQRARWFGYKAGYLGFCRVYLDQDTLDSYKGYVSHEEDIRSQLAEHLSSGRALSEWRRVFLLSPKLRPTRSSVLDLDYVRGNLADDWYHPAQPHCSQEATTRNREVVRQYLASLQFQPDDEHMWSTETQHHSAAPALPLKSVYEQLLTKLWWAMEKDSERYFGVQLQLKSYLERYPSASCSIYLMSQGSQRERATDSDGNVEQLFQGEQFTKSGRTYEGDRRIRASEGVSVQVHWLGIKIAGATLSDIPLVAVWVPKEASAAWLAQPQGGSKDVP